MELKYLLALHSLPGLGQRRLKMLIDYFQSSEYAWQQEKHWMDVPGFTTGGRAETVLAGRRSCDPERVYHGFLQSGVKIVTINDASYPLLLKQIYDPPYLLFYRGELPCEADTCIGMVGTRKATAYGRLMAETLAGGLGEKKIWVVSGMARGIDTWSHKGCLKGGGKTLGVLGSGLDVIYPRENKELYGEIAASGAVVSELPLGTQPLPQHFPARNRIISGLCRGIVVVEAAEKSGSLITVDFALEQGRDVFAVPGPVTSPLSRGTHKLIKQGAKLVEKPEDVLEEYFSSEPAFQSVHDLFAFSPIERRLLESLMGGEVHFDVLVEESGMPAFQMASLLTLWEIKGLVKQLPGKYYIIGNLV